MNESVYVLSSYAVKLASTMIKLDLYTYYHQYYVFQPNKYLRFKRYIEPLNLQFYKRKLL